MNVTILRSAICAEQNDRVTDQQWGTAAHAVMHTGHYTGAGIETLCMEGAGT